MTSQRNVFAGGLVLLCAVTLEAATVLWNGGDGQWTNGANWTPSGVPAAGDSVVFSNVATACTVSSIADNLASITVLSNYTGTITFAPNCVGGTTNSLTLSGDLTVYGGAMVFQGNTNSSLGMGFVVHAANVTVASNGTLSVNGQGFTSCAGPAAGSNNLYYGAGGGAYGGMGGNSSGNGMGATNLYGSVVAPMALGSGGGVDIYSGYSGSIGGSGGGALALLAGSGTVTVNGTISANGSAPSPINRQGGGGSGGSIYIVCSQLTGGGLISADGGAGGNRADWESGGGGGGGRIKLDYSASSFTGTVSVAGGSGGTGASVGEAGYPGTFSFPDGSDVTVKRSFALAPGSYNIPTLIVRSNAILSCQGNAMTTSGVTITSTTITIDQGGAISANSQGFLCGRGPGTGGNVSMHGGGGASHAGIGGKGEGDSYGSGALGGTVIYGVSNSPVALGSGGGIDTYYPQQVGAGGGAIHLTALSGTVTVNGSLSANGKYGTKQQQGGGGSGGSVWVECDTLAGSGSITAMGGDGGTKGSWAAGGGGGGGRVALACAFANFTGSTNVNGGVAPTNGAAGTIVVQSREPATHPPHLSNLVVSAISMANATLTGMLTDTGSAPPVVSIYWGPSDAVSNKGSWARSVEFGAYAGGTLPLTYSTNITLEAFTNMFCYCRMYASNSIGETWSAVTNFMVGEVNFSPLTASASQFGPTPGTVTVTRASTLTNGALSVTYSMGGSATSGVDYQPLSGTIVLPAGVASASVVVTPIVHRLIEGARDAILTISAGSYIVGAVNQATVTIAANPGIPPLTLNWNGGDGSWTNGANWSPAYVPVVGDSIVFGSVSSNCSVASMPTSLASLVIQSSYSGTVSLLPNCAGGTSALVVGSNLVVNGGTLLLGGDTNAGTGFCLTAAGISVGVGGTISANAQGYPCQSGTGAGSNDTYYGGGGGSHGGRGGWSAGGRNGGINLYDSATAPVALGSGGGIDTSFSAPYGGAGGGALKLVTAGSLSLDGTVTANGGAGTAAKNNGGGSGGSIWLVCGQFSGSGTVQADGGAGGSYNVGYNNPGGGGGGGRVKFEYATSTFNGTVSVAGGAGGSSDATHPSGQAGYPGTFSFPDGGNVTVKGSFALAPGTYNIPSLVVQSNTILSCQGDLATSNGVVIIASSITVNSGGTIAADAQGFPASMGPGAGLNGSADGGGGGSYGGLGGVSISTSKVYGGTAPGACYGSALTPLLLGSGGGIDAYGPTYFINPIGYGGGAVKLDAGSGTITINGTVSANGGAANPKRQGGGGSGGSVWITCGTLTGSGTVSADGGAGGNHDGNDWSNGGGGGGGRICLNYTSSTYSGSLSAVGGLDGLGRTNGETCGFPGTLHVPDGTSLTVSRSIALAPGNYAIPTLVVQSNAILSCQGDPVTTSGVTITSSSITVNQGGGISADSQGYPMATGPGKGSSSTYWGGGGASHAGIGGHASNSLGAAGSTYIYGSSNAPVTLGSGGGASTIYSNGASFGGGAVHLVASSGTITIDGALSANGGSGSRRHQSGGGSGGSVWVDCKTLQGNGVISATGGDGGSTCEHGNGGGGGGGRVRLKYTYLNYSGATNVLGGTGPTNGLPGMVTLEYVPSQGCVYLYR